MKTEELKYKQAVVDGKAVEKVVEIKANLYKHALKHLGIDQLVKGTKEYDQTEKEAEKMMQSAFEAIVTGQQLTPAAPAGAAPALTPEQIRAAIAAGEAPVGKEKVPYKEPPLPVSDVSAYEQ